MKILLASRNQGKLREIREILSDSSLEWRTLQDFPQCPEAEESADTYIENAREKSQIAAEHSGLWSLADDSGLEVESLGWKPGVRSARFAGPSAKDRENNECLLMELAGQESDRRRAVFRCVLVLRHPSGREFVSEGELWGKIATEARGEAGFGYDPLFIPDGHPLTLAELPSAEKNLISHRTLALRKMREFLSPGSLSL